MTPTVAVKDSASPEFIRPSSSSEFDDHEYDHKHSHNFYSGGSICEIVEEVEEEEEEEDLTNSRDLFEIKNGIKMATVKEDYDSNLFSFDVQNADDVVYVVIWKMGNEEQSSVSMDALVWTLNRYPVITESSSAIVYLIHVFPELRHIPTPLGKLPISQANPEQKESFMIQERSKRRDFLQKFLDLRSTNKVQLETVLIESDMEAKAILDLIPILNIRKLVLGTTKSSLRKMRSRRGSGTADQILQNAPDFCEVKLICEGKEVSPDQLAIESSPSPSPSPSRRGIIASPRPMQVQAHVDDSFTCSCFKPKVVS